ncbi:hypothetical protein SSAmo_0660 [Enterobacterales bacterium endosymbiont of Anomoneura mori]
MKKAASEIYKKVKKILNNNIKNIKIGTFHSIIYKILYSYYYEKFNVKIKIIKKFEQINIIKNIIKKLGIDFNKYNIELLIKYINNKNLDLFFKNYKNKKFNKIDNFLLIYKKYKENCKKNYLFDFEKIILKINFLLLNNSNFYKKYFNKIKYIFVDEFQDINKLIYNFLNLIKNKNNNIMLIGDDDQAIYNWRGSENELIEKFKKKNSKN